MCETGNLIDLSDREETSMTSKSLQQNSITANPSNSWLLQQSFENNPFDSMQKLANRQDDPFDIVEKEAFSKAGVKLDNSEVKVENLLTIEDDSNDLLIGGNIVINNEQSGNKTFWNADCAQISSEYTNKTPDSGGGDSTESEASSNGEVSKNKKYLESRKKLLKLSITNSTFNSPMNRPFTRQTSGEAFPENDGYCSPISSLYSHIIQLNEPMLEVESPLKLIEDDLLMEEPPVFLDSDKDFEAELEMLKIPMLNELRSLSGEQIDASVSTGTETRLNAESEPLISVEDVLPDLVALRAKLNTRRSDTKSVANVSVTDNPKDQDIGELVQHLKLLIHDIDFEDDNRKQKATSLLKSLSSALICNSAIKQIDNQIIIPQSIVRQGTFDLDSKELHVQEEDCKDHKLNETNAIHKELNVNLGVENIPDVMLKSSATYDCETAEEKDNYELPDCNDYPQSISPPQTNVNDLIVQLNKLCEQNFLNTNVNQNNEETGSSIHSNNTSAVNPTFIFVMPPSTVLPPYMNASRQPSPDHHSSNSNSMRRRSQSLSLHDKVKIMQLPVEANHETTSPVNLNDFSSSTTPPNAVEFKTPMRCMPRRNSFSNGSPFTTITRPNNNTSRRSYFGNDGISHLSTNFSRSATALSPHAEKKEKHRAVVLPITQSNMNLFKPDLKKRSRTNASTSSIFKSTVPLKATIPIKRVTPLMKTATSTDATHEHQLHAKFEIPTPVKLSANFPKACSTPTNITRTPLTRNSIAATKSRYSSVNNATAARSALVQNTSSISRRRSIAETKMKSPIKMGRQSVNGSNIDTTQSTAKGITGMMPLGPSRLAKSSAIVANRGMTHRIGSVIGANATKCKENKKP